jgi:hypothetical protein
MALKTLVTGNDTVTISDNNMSVVGETGGSQKVKLAAGITGLTTNADVDSIDLAGNLADFTFLNVVGTGTQIRNAAGTVVATVPSVNNTTGIPVAFANGTATLVQTATGFTLGGQAISTTATAAVTATLDTTVKSTVTTTTPAVVTPSGSFTMTSSAVAGVATAEGNTIALTITPTAAVAAATTLNLNVTGQALGGYTNTTTAADFGTIPSVSFAAGATAAQTVNITVATDTTAEGIEAYKIALLNSVGTEVATALTGIVNDVAATSSGTVAGTNFSLTVGNDNLTATSGNDTFDGGLFFNTPSGTYVQTLASGDSLDAGAGTDTLNVTFTTGATYTPLALRNLEVINLTNQGVAGVIDLSNATGITTLANVGSTTSIASFTNVQSAPTTFNLSNTAMGMSVGVANTALSGTTDTAALNISNMTAGIITLQTVSAASGFETLNVVSNGSTANVLTQLTDGNGTSLATINVSGANNINLGSALDTSVTTVNASTFTGNLTVDVSGAANVSVTGGTGADTFTYGLNYTAADNINGGAGTDTLSVTTAMLGGISATQTNVSLIETLSVSDATTAVTYTPSAFGAINMIFTTASTAATTVNYATGTAGLTYGAVIGTGIQTLNSAGSSTTDVLNLTVGTSSAGVLETSETATTGFETINLLSRGGTNSTGAITMTVTASTETLIITGGVALTLGAVTADRIDASAFTAGLTMVTGTVAAGGVVILGGTVADTLFGTAAADVITSGAGDDTMTGGIGGDILTGGAGFDTFRFSTGITSAANYATNPNITDFTVGSTAALSDKFGISQGDTFLAAGNAGLVTGAGAAGSLAASVAGDANTVVQTVAQNAAAAAIGATTDFLKLTTGVAAAASNQLTFNAAIGTATITGLNAAGLSMAGSFYDTTNSRAVIFEVLDTGNGSDTAIATADVIRVIGTINMTSADYATFGANQLEFF